MIRQNFVVLGILTILFISTLPNSSSIASASSVGPHIFDLTQLQRTCAVLAVHLNGAHHTTTCIHTQMPKQQPGLTPSLNQGPCIPFVTTMQIFNYAYGATLCFEGTGYLGVRIYQVNEVDNINSIFGWVKWYHQGSNNGHNCIIYASESGYWGNNTNVTLTQIDIAGLERAPSYPQCPQQ